MSEARELPVFQGWTVDVRLGEFRKVWWNKKRVANMKVIDFASTPGAKMLEKYLRS